PEVRVAGGAADLDPPHAVARVDLGLDRVLPGGLEEARPAGAGVELRVGAEQLGAARTAPEDAVLLHAVEAARRGRLGRSAAKNRVAVGIALLPPLLVGLTDLLHAVQSRSRPIRYASLGATSEGQSLERIFHRSKTA